MIEFWFEFASTYSYPAAMRIEKVAGAAGLHVVWKPMLLGPLFNAQQGLKDSPFNAFPVKGRYMWRDLERTCIDEGLPLKKPEIFPQNGLKAARIVLALPDAALLHLLPQPAGNSIAWEVQGNDLLAQYHLVTGRVHITLLKLKDFCIGKGIVTKERFHSYLHAKRTKE